MSGLRSMIRRVATMGVAITLACGEAPAPTEVVDSPALSAVPGQKAVVLELTSPNSRTLSKTATIGVEGGKITVSGVQLSIPANALDGDTEITLTVPAGNYAQATFEPHGLQFNTPASLTFNGVNGSAVASGVYFEGDDVGSAGVVTAAEVLPVSVRGNSVTIGISHFSGYCLSTGTCECY